MLIEWIFRWVPIYMVFEQQALCRLVSLSYAELRPNVGTHIIVQSIESRSCRKSTFFAANGGGDCIACSPPPPPAARRAIERALQRPPTQLAPLLLSVSQLGILYWFCFDTPPMSWNQSNANNWCSIVVLLGDMDVNHTLLLPIENDLKYIMCHLQEQPTW